MLLRVTPGIEAHTHDYILTGQEDSKFGFDLMNGQAEAALKQALKSEWIHVLGLHCHIGSQIFQTTGFILAAQKIIGQLRNWHGSILVSATSIKSWWWFWNSLYTKKMNHFQHLNM